MNSNKFKKAIESAIENMSSELYKYRVDCIEFQYIKISKVRNCDKYNVCVSVDDVETPIILIRDVIDTASQILSINVDKVTIEI